MSVIQTWFGQDLQKAVKVNHIDGNLFSHNGNGNSIGVRVYNDGEPVTLTGTVSGYVITSDGSTVPCVGARSGNEATITIPPAAYQPGNAFITIFLTDGSTVTTLCAAQTTVLQARTGSQVSPGSVVQDWTQTINAAMQSVEDASENLGGIIATPYASLTYPVPLGKYTYYNSNLYRCISPIETSEEFTAAHWTQVKLGDDVSDLKSAFDSETSNLITETDSIHTNTAHKYIPNFVQGRIDSHTDPAVIVSADTTRVITKDIINFIAYDNIEITAAEGYRVAVWRYTGESESDYASNTGWITSYNPASLGVRCLRIFVSKTDSSAITPDEAKNNIAVTLYGHSIPNNFENISFRNAIRDWADALTISGRVDATHGISDSGYRMSPQIRCVPGDRIIGTSAGTSGLRIFVVYDKFGVISYQVLGTGASNAINIDYTFTDNDYYFVIVCIASALDRYSISYVSKYDFPILSTGEIAKNTVTLDNFDLDFEIGGLNAAQTPPWWTATPVTRIRNMRSRPFLLKNGDSIYLTDYTDAMMYVVWHNPSDDTWGSKGWINIGVFNVSIDGEYWVLLRNATEVTITDISSLSSLLRVEKHGDYHGYVDDAIIPAQRTDWIIKSINHRGYGRLAPENTIPAYALSAKLGWKYVETDIRFTSDGVAVLLHDESINRTARNADGTEISETINIADITYEQALTYDFGIWKGEPYRGTKIPTLAEFVQFCKNASLDMYLEIKVESGTRVADAVSIVRRGGMLKHATWIAFSWTALQKVSVVDPDARLGLLGTSITSSIIDILNTLKNDTNEVFLNCSVHGVNSEGCDLIAESGFPLEVYTPNDVATIAGLDPYITGVSSDYSNAGLAMFNKHIK